MEDIFESLSYQRGSITQSINQSVTEVPDLLPSIHDNVKVSPSKMVFTDAFDGKKFKKSFTIVNCGKYPVFVRIFPPTSQAFKMKPLKRGKNLPSGLSVTRTICYTHSSAMALNKACLFVYVNEKPFSYQIEVHLISAYVSVEPKVLNFGEIDVGNASDQMFLQLRNTGRRIAQFSIDLGRNDLELIVDPMKGTIMPDGVIEVKVEVLGFQTGTFCKEFWVKTEPPRRVKLTGVFIAPRVVFKYPLTNFNFTLIDFPKTYYGAKSVKTVVISNTSSMDRMFCLVAEKGKKLDYLINARKSNDNLKYFTFNSMEGRLLARQNYILRFTFTPMNNRYKKFCQTFIRVVEVNYRDGIVAEREDVVKTFTSAASVEEFLSSPIDNLQEFDDIEIPDSGFLRICLYGEMEEPSVKMSPEDFTLDYLKIDETYDRILNIKNMSHELPITLKSNIVSCVKVNPPELSLGPDESLEVTLSITPSEEGARHYKIIFHLIHNEHKIGAVSLPVSFSATKIYPKVEPKFNMGITPMITNEVGFLVDDIKFNSKTGIPRQAIVDKNHKSFNKNNSALIAFPNDMPKSLRPWKSKVPCRTIFSNMPRVVSDQDEYTLTAEEAEKKEQNDKVYSDYLKKEAERRKPWESFIKTSFGRDYEITDKRRLLMERLHPSDSTTHNHTHHYGCIPLPPAKLLEVIIKPKYVYLGKIAPYTTCTDSFSIENNNEFSVHVSIKALSNSVVIKEKSRIVIEPKKTKDIFFDCFSHGYGKFYVPVYIIINDSHIFDGTVFASVVPTTVKCDQKEIIINPKTHRSFFELYNPVNCEIKFSWEIQDKNFRVVPESGVVPPRKYVYCSVMFIPQINATYKTEIYLLSQSGAKQIITVICRNERASVGFSTEVVEFNNIPLNIRMVKHVVMRNFSDEEIVFLVENPNPIHEISIFPTAGKINAKSDIDFSIAALFKDVVSFQCPVTIILQDDYYYTLNIKGNVVFPTVTIVPHHIQIPKVPLGCYKRENFKIKNTSAAKNVITFDFDEIPEFCVTDLKHKPIDTLTLKPDEMKEMILEFKPTEPVAYSLYFPYKMNDIIGPPLLNDSTSLHPDTYLKKTGVVSFKENADLPKSIATLNIRCAASGDWFKFSSLHLVFNYENKGKCRKHFTITNISRTNHRFTVPFIDSNYPFSMKMEKKKGCDRTENSLAFTVEPNETISFRLDYAPSEFSKSTMELPIYVEAFPFQCPFTYLKLTGVFARPVITSENQLLYFQAILSKEKINKRITLQLNSHQRDCVINVDVRHDTLSVKFLRRTDPEKPSDATYSSVADYLIKFQPGKECIVHSSVLFSCSCKASFEITVKASADNCIFCSYQSIIKMRAASEGEKFESTYPFYPAPEDNSYYAKTVKVIKDDVEMWLCSQGFFYKSFYKIPYGLSRFPVDIHPKSFDSKTSKITALKTKPEKSEPTLPLVQLLVNLVDPNVTKYFYDGLSEPCYEGTEGIFYAYSVYKQILSFLEVQGVFVAQLKPEYLLPFHNYVIFKENFVTEDCQFERVVFSREGFRSFTKQAWLDLILRIYRVFVYNRTTNPFLHKQLKKPPKPLIYEEELMQYFSEKRGLFCEKVNENEAKLMMWLQFHFEKQRHIVWDEQTNLNLAKKKIRSFEKDLADGLPFVTLTVAYCPYMRQCFDNFFPLYQNEEDIYHNACIIYETWKRLCLSYELRPIRMVKSSATEMEILVTYLYDVLPNFYPTETITFNTSLGDESANKILLKNRGDAVIAYTPLFFLNDTEAFAVDKEIVTIPPGGTNALKVSYKAKSILKKTAVLLLSGETIGYKFAKTMAFNLVGIPNIFAFTEEYTFNVNVFKQTKKTIEVSSPFAKEYEAKLYVFLGDHTKPPESLDEFVAISFMIGQRVPRQMSIKSECNFASDGEGVIKLNMCYIACGHYTYFVYASNKDVGDFCIKVNVKASYPEKNAVDIPVNLSREFSTEKCICVSALNAKCPRVVVVDIPCKNQQLIDGLTKFFENYADEDEYNFWKPLLDHPKGIHVLKEYLENTFDEKVLPFKDILQCQVTYDILTKSSKKFAIAKGTTIEDITSSCSHALQIHWNSREFPVREVLTLVATHEKEVRKYILKFKKSEM